MLNIDSLSKRYGEVVGVDDVSAHVGAGEVVGVLGPNGSGKSTLLHCVTGIVSPSSGAIEIAGAAAETVEAKRRFGFVPDDLDLPETVTGREYLQFLSRLHDTTEDVSELAAVLDLDSAMDRLVAGYSHGMRRKLLLLAALQHRPPLLILDEPFGGLDPVAAIVVRRVLTAWPSPEGRATLIATHDLLAAERLCDRVLILAGGRLVAEGRPSELLEVSGEADLERFFIGVSGIGDDLDRADEILGAM